MDDATRVEIFRRCLLARRLEERIIQLAMAGELAATLHPGQGQEIAQVAALAALRPDDPMLYGHRGLAYWIARGLPPERILCELAFKEGSTNRGKGGVMHVVDPALGILGESGTLGGNFVIGAGVALAEKLQRTGRVAVIFFGDGTSNRGQFHEAANFCAVRKLPALFFCENNGWAVSVSARVSTAVADIADRAAAYAMPGVVVDGNDPEAVFEATAAAARRARAGDGPSLVEAKVERLLGHFLGDPQPYRSAAERTALRERDPMGRFERDLRARGLLDDSALAALEGEIAARITAAEAAERRASLVAPATALERVYAS
ncbi:MAG TPA: thiamine pyrophosphate-dependent dehydrogenase E1 component subunit alpha [Myxococcota bacterium]|nr:thiamine pyrophosphate-dependent dehydrogenase E1 component subunit alpha [Myxococcota bacterium]